MFHAAESFTRLQVRPRDVLVPFFILLAANIIVLCCWTALDPLTYVRANHEGLDGWNRVISTYGRCQSDHVFRYMGPLWAINLVVLLIANWQAYRARKIKLEFSEGKYIGLAMASILQCGLMGCPILFLVSDNPQAFYLVLVFMIFVVAMGVLSLIFVPKIILQDKYSHADPTQQMRMILDAVRDSQDNRSSSRATAIAGGAHNNSYVSTISAANDRFSAAESEAPAPVFGSFNKPIESEESCDDINGDPGSKDQSANTN